MGPKDRGDEYEYDSHGNVHYDHERAVAAEAANEEARNGSECRDMDVMESGNESGNESDKK